MCNGAVSCEQQEPFPGTIFRLPLRTAAQAATSRLSKSVPDVGQLQTLFQSEAASLLLFLKSVEELEWSVWTDRAAPDGGDDVKVDASANSPMPIFNIKLEFGVVTSPSSGGAPAVKTVDAKQQATTRTNR